MMNDGTELSEDMHALLREGRRHYRRTGTKLLVFGQRWSYGGRSGWHYVLLTPALRSILGRSTR